MVSFGFRSSIEQFVQLYGLAMGHVSKPLSLAEMNIDFMTPEGHF